MSLRGEEMQRLHKEQEEWFKEQGEGYFISPEEGLQWERAENQDIDETKLIEEITHAKRDRGLRGAIIKVSQFDVGFHALRFPDGRQWDTVNGFRK